MTALVNCTHNQLKLLGYFPVCIRAERRGTNVPIKPQDSFTA